MAQEENLTRGLGWLALVVVAAVFGLGFLILDRRAESRPQQRTGQADVLTIATLRAFGPLERPPVTFKHDFHVQKLQAAAQDTDRVAEQASSQNDDCSVCHLAGDEGAFNFRFKRLSNESWQSVRDVYHNECISCHQQLAAGPGPEACGICHRSDPEVFSSRAPAGHDLGLHARHISSSENRCERCHHVYDEQKQALVYVKGTEGSCRVCHRQQTEDKRISFREAAHAGCVNCHLANDLGPHRCDGCHDAAVQKALARPVPLPRLERGQPDAVFLHAAAEDLNDSKMPVVPFDHKAHELQNSTCRVCHHEGMQACRACHTLAGAEAGAGITLAIAMHTASADHSCVGCHATFKAQAGCAGCHAPIPSHALSAQFCGRCHAGPSPAEVQAAGEDGLPAPVFSADPAMTRFSFAADEIPETVVIGKLVDRYEPAEMPHRKIVEKLRGIIGESAMARHFHADADLVCQGCHHHSPVGTRPPLCSNCHREPFQVENIHAPGLYGAYHRQCVGCHQQMDLKDGCTDCHRERGTQAVTAAAGR